MDTQRLISIFLGMMFVTYIPRLLPLFALSQVRLPDLLMSWLSYLPAAILSALILPGALMRDGAIDAGISNPSLWALAASFVVAIWTRNLILTMVVGGVVIFLGQIVL
ncbi:MAG: AzlD domain-containing protein [bacterium]|nr:AzlD domain-containing protein [bacterium]MDT8366273.1 AzlD domain-containing protein [bacterium]